MFRKKFVPPLLKQHLPLKDRESVKSSDNEPPTKKRKTCLENETDENDLDDGCPLEATKPNIMKQEGHLLKLGASVRRPLLAVSNLNKNKSSQEANVEKS